MVRWSCSSSATVPPKLISLLRIIIITIVITLPELWSSAEDASVSAAFIALTALKALFAITYSYIN